MTQTLYAHMNIIKKERNTAFQMTVQSGVTSKTKQRASNKETK
jgi:hypothetical protein